jgi:chemosensory pili system protein ChpA (sensor histidine kinase/response regulator)
MGKIEIALTRRGSMFILEVKDDGRGIDSEHIASIAKAKLLPLTDTSTPEKLLRVLCQPGFTSAETVSDISGRGVVMDVVANQVQTLGGQMDLSTQVGKGTTFTLQIPVPHLFVRCMLLQSGDRTFAVPTTEVFTTMLLEGMLWQQVKPDPDHPKPYIITVQEDSGEVPAIDLYHYWQGGKEVRPLLPTTVAVRTKQPNSNCGVWLIADSLIGQNDLLIEPLPQPLSAPIGLLGVSLLADGKLVPVIDPLPLTEALLSDRSGDLDVSIHGNKAAIAPPVAPSGMVARQILVVDDAALMRRRLESSLSVQGYDVRTCGDGQEAWEWLQANAQPALLITDIEMPRMDGFTLIDRCRQAGWHLPILVVSSRLAEEWSKETSRLGATDYLTKGFSTTELLTKVATLLESADQSIPRSAKIMPSEVERFARPV